MPKKPQETSTNKMQVEENFEEISLATENEVLKVEVADLQRKLATATIQNQEQQEQLLQRRNPASLQPLQSPQPPQPPQAELFKQAQSPQSNQAYSTNQAYEMQPPPTTQNKC